MQNFIDFMKHNYTMKNIHRFKSKLTNLPPVFVKRIRSKRTNRQKLNRKYLGFCAQNEKILFDIYSRST